MEGHLMDDHIHILIEIPAKYPAVREVVYIKGKRAIHIARTYEGRQKNFTGQNSWT
jgi:putative transposase